MLFSVISAKISGPLLDRIDIQIEIVRLPLRKFRILGCQSLVRPFANEYSKAREIQLRRFTGETDIHCNAQMIPALIRQYVRPNEESLQKLKSVMERLAFRPEHTTVF